MSSFALNIKAWTEKAKAKQEDVVRVALLGVFQRIVIRTPVGDPKTWKINAGFRAAVQSASEENARRRTMAEFTNKNGRLKKGKKVHPEAQVHFATQHGPVAFKQRGWAAKNYTGGRLRGNWQIGLDVIPPEQLDTIDKSGAATLERGKAALAAFEIGSTKNIYFANNLPYAPRIEYEGWSKKAPAGMVGVSVAEFNQAVAEAVKEVNK